MRERGHRANSEHELEGFNMMIKFPCPSCKTELKAPEGTEGRSSRCKCGQAVTVPSSIPVAAIVAELPKTNSASTATPKVRRNERLDTCRDCGREVSRSAYECPNCGCPFEKRKTPSVHLTDQASALLSVCSLGLFFVAQGTPLLFVNSYIVPGILTAIGGIGAASYSFASRKWSSGSIIGLVAGLLALGLWALLIAWMQERIRRF